MSVDYPRELKVHLSDLLISNIWWIVDKNKNIYIYTKVKYGAT